MIKIPLKKTIRGTHKLTINMQIIIRNIYKTFPNLIVLSLKTSNRIFYSITRVCFSQTVLRISLFIVKKKDITVTKHVFGNLLSHLFFNVIIRLLRTMSEMKRKNFSSVSQYKEAYTISKLVF